MTTAFRGTLPKFIFNVSMPNCLVTVLDADSGLTNVHASLWVAGQH